MGEERKGNAGEKSGADKKKMKHRPEKGRVAKQRRGDTKRSEYKDDAKAGMIEEADKQREGGGGVC